MTASIIKFPAKVAKPVAVPMPCAPTPEALCDLFDDALAVYELRAALDIDPTFNLKDVPVRIDTVFESLKFCDETMPPNLCERISLLLCWPDRCPPNSHYSRGARLMLRLLANKDALR